MPGEKIPSAQSFSPAASFLRTPQGADITYDPARLPDPVAFVAAMAHELAHYLVAEIPEPPPGGEEAHELATDLAAVFLGFGVFLVESAYSVRSYSLGRFVHGWSVSRQGYLTELQLLFALAVFTVLVDEKPRNIAGHLKTHYRTLYGEAVKQLRGDARIDALREIPPLAAAGRTLTAPETADGSVTPPATSRTSPS
jgi:hypothetical protein